jgi:hypothetical protein
MTYQKQIEAALAYSGDTHTYADVMRMVDEGRLQLWPGVNSVVVTEIIEYPQKKTLHFFIAGGNIAELEAMYPLIIEWGLIQGCNAASLVGRPGWTRSFLSRKEGWHDGLVVMQKDLAPCPRELASSKQPPQ